MLNPEKSGLGMIFFCLLKRIKINLYDYKIYEEGSNIKPIVEFYRISGEYDYLFKVVAADMQASDIFIKLVNGVDLSNIASRLALEQIKYTTALPV